MVTRRILLLILSILALPSLAACSSNTAPAAPPPPSEVSLAAVSDDPAPGRVALARAVDALFDEDAVGKTRALLVMHGGEIVAERYGEGYGRDTRLHGWSASKCVTGIMIGLLVSDGRLRRDESAPVALWRRSGDARGEITLRQLLQMRSGLRHDEDTDPVYASDTVRMLFLDGRENMARFAEAQPLESEPGRVYEYSSATSVILADVAAHALTRSSDPQRRRKAVSGYLRTRFFDPVGLSSMTPQYDPAGTMIGAAMIHATARDWGKLGEFMRHGGSVRGAQIIPRRWIEFMRAPSPRNPAFGAHVWLNQPRPEGDIELFPGKAPESLFACVGHLGQYVIGSPEQKLTVVRLGHTIDEQRPELRRHLGDLIALFPAR